MTIEQWLSAQKASMDPALQASAPLLKWFKGSVDDEESKAKAKASSPWPYIQFVMGDEVPTVRTHNGETIYNCPSYFNIFCAIVDGATPPEREVILWRDVLASLHSFYRDFGIDKVDQSVTAKLIKIEKANAANTRIRKVQQGLLMCTVYQNILIVRP
jgi:hypothetical protein